MQYPNKAPDNQLEELVWDFSEAGKIHTGDGLKRSEVSETLRLCHVDTKELWRALHITARQHDKSGNLGRDFHSPDKRARAIKHWKEGRVMTPPVIRLHPNFTSEVFVQSGQHRLGIALELMPEELPIYIEESEFAALQSTLRVGRQT